MPRKSVVEIPTVVRWNNLLNKDAADTAENMESEENGQRETVNSSNALILPVIFIALAVFMVEIVVISFCKRKK